MQIQIAKEDIKWYIATAPKFGEALHLVGDLIESSEKELTVSKVTSEFREACKRLLGNDIGFRDSQVFPFELQKNSFGEKFDRELCVSINQCVAHGKPSQKLIIKHGDVVSIDGGVSGIAPSGRRMYFDSAITVVRGGGKRLNPIVAAPAMAINRMVELKGNINTKQLSEITQSIAEEFQFNIVVDLSGHGIGYNLHTDPMITNMTSSELSVDLVPRTFICPEPMYVANGNGMIASCHIDSDGWSVVAKDTSSHWETVLYYDGNKLIDVVGIISP